MIRRYLVVGASAFALLASSRARADNGSESADRLFREGQALLRKDTPRACEKFAASYAKEAMLGTLLNLAFCHEKDGELWDAWLEYRQAAADARVAGKRDRVDFAVAHAEDVAKKMPRVAFQFDESLTRAGIVSVTIDGHALAEADYIATFPLPPGERRVVIVFRDKPEIQMAAPIATDTSSVQTVRVASKEPPPPVVVVAPPLAQQEVAPSPPQNDSKRTIAYLVGGAGVASMLLGTYFGVHTLSLKSDANSKCGAANNVCATPAQSSAANVDENKASSSATASDITFALGIAAIAGGAVLYAMSHDPNAPHPDDSKAAHFALTFTPIISRNVAGGSFALRF